MPSRHLLDPHRCSTTSAVTTHRVAISNNRLVDSDDGHVRFRWKDYRNRDRHKTMTLSAEEFIHRFLIHVLPNRFQRIRYFGLSQPIVADNTNSPMPPTFGDCHLPFQNPIPPDPMITATASKTLAECPYGNVQLAARGPCESNFLVAITTGDSSGHF